MYTVRACRPVSPGFMVKIAPVKSGLADVWICGLDVMTGLGLGLEIVLRLGLGIGLVVGCRNRVSE